MLNKVHFLSTRLSASPSLCPLLQTSFLLLITLSSDGTETLPAEQKPVALLCIGCSLIASSVLLLQKSIWKAFYRSSKLPAKTTAAVVRQHS